LLRPAAFRKDNAGGDEFRERGLEFGAGFRRQRFKQWQRKLPADNGRDLSYLTRLAKTVEARRERILE